METDEVEYTEPAEGCPDRIALNLLRGNLAASDYKVMKRVEGELPDDEFEQARAMRARWRSRIREIEARIAGEVCE